MQVDLKGTMYYSYSDEGTMKMKMKMNISKSVNHSIPADGVSRVR